MTPDGPIKMKTLAGHHSRKSLLLWNAISYVFWLSKCFRTDSAIKLRIDHDCHVGGDITPPTLFDLQRRFCACNVSSSCPLILLTGINILFGFFIGRGEATSFGSTGYALVNWIGLIAQRGLKKTRCGPKVQHGLNFKFNFGPRLALDHAQPPHI